FVADRYWTRQEVEALIPTLTEIMSRVQAARAEATALKERMQDEKRRIAMSGGAAIDVRGWRDDRAKLERATEETRAGLQRIVERERLPMLDVNGRQVRSTAGLLHAILRDHAPDVTLGACYDALIWSWQDAERRRAIDHREVAAPERFGRWLTRLQIDPSTCP